MKIAILLATYNGARYLQEQLDSFERQSHSDWTLWASDDGSSDDSVEIIKRFREKMRANKVNQFNGPQKGFAANFLNLVRNPDIKADGYAYSDQDDIWIPDKLERAVQFLAAVPINTPALYCSRTHYVNKDNRLIRDSCSFSKPTLFSNALIQNIASGNTMVFNQAARALLLEIDRDSRVDLHDWLTYILVTGAGGQVLFDIKPSVRYRQHNGNLIGMNIGLKAAIYRLYMLFYKGRFRKWNGQHIVILNKLQYLLTPSNRIIFESFVKARESKSYEKIFSLKRIGLYRQTFFGNIAFYLAALMNKV